MGASPPSRADEPTASGGAAARWVKPLLVFHFAALIVFRLIADNDEFNNWDLIALLNAQAFRSRWELLSLPQVHFLQPFRFPTYNTGTESVLSLLLHGSIGRLFPYWSNAMVLAVYDCILLAALYVIVQSVFRREDARRTAWACMAMSPVLLTFQSISAFDTQAFATILTAIAGVEFILRSRAILGAGLVGVAFVQISQAYGLTFFLPLYCGAWLVSRSMMLALDEPAASGARRRNFLIAGAAIAACMAIVEVASSGEYLRRVIGLVSRTARDRQGVEVTFPSLIKAHRFLREAMGSSLPYGRSSGGFFPFFLVFEGGLLLGLIALEILRRGTASFPRLIARAGAWGLLLALGYSAAIHGSKSQRAFLGEVFLALTVAALFESWQRIRRIVPRSFFLQLAAVLALSNGYYVYSVLRVSHQHNHTPVFDYDTADGVVRHDVNKRIREMRRQRFDENAFLVLNYPRGADENHTDPSVFYARFLRYFGRYDNDRELVVTCRFCDLPYGCPFPHVRRSKCTHSCCYEDPMVRLASLREARTRIGYLWTYADSDETSARQRELLKRLEHRYALSEMPRFREGGWTCFRLDPAASSPRRKKNSRMRRQPAGTGAKAPAPA